MNGSVAVLEASVVAAVVADPVCAAVLERMPHLGLDEWWLTGGAVFQNVWNTVEGHPAGYGIKDYDVFYYGNTDLSWEAEDAVIRQAANLFADVPAHIELRNEARVHIWYEAKFGVPQAPFTSATDAIDAFASTTCCVGLTRSSTGSAAVQIYAPFGLQDVFAMRMRPNRRVAARHVYDAKVVQYRERWPSLTSDPW